MKQPTKELPVAPEPHASGPAHPPRAEPAPKEPAEVLGRHKNTGQKDHKGAR